MIDLILKKGADPFFICRGEGMTFFELCIKDNDFDLFCYYWEICEKYIIDYNYQFLKNVDVIELINYAEFYNKNKFIHFILDKNIEINPKEYINLEPNTVNYLEKKNILKTLELT